MTDQAAKKVKKASHEVELIVETVAKQRLEKQAHNDAQAVTKMKKKVPWKLSLQAPQTCHLCLNMKYTDFKTLKGTT